MYLDNFFFRGRIYNFSKSDVLKKKLLFYIQPKKKYFAMLFFSTGAFSIVHFPRNMTVNETGRVSFFCNATSEPPYQNLKPQITWSKVGDSGNVLSQQEELVLTNVGHPDEGTYICTAKNGAGEPDTASAILTVLRK